MVFTKPHPFNEAGRRLKAALISYQLGLTGVDRTLKEMRIATRSLPLAVAPEFIYWSALEDDFRTLAFQRCT